MTDWPEAAEDVAAGVAPGEAPLLTTKIWNDGPPVGAGAHWKAQPMFQVPPAMVKAGLVQLPVCCVSGMSTVAGPTAAGAEVVEVALDASVEEVVPPAAVVAVDPPAAVVEVPAPGAPAAVPAEAPLGGGSL